MEFPSGSTPPTPPPAASALISPVRKVPRSSPTSGTAAPTSPAPMRFSFTTPATSTVPMPPMRWAEWARFLAARATIFLTKAGSSRVTRMAIRAGPPAIASFPFPVRIWWTGTPAASTPWKSCTPTSSSRRLGTCFPWWAIRAAVMSRPTCFTMPRSTG